MDEQTQEKTVDTIKAKRIQRISQLKAKLQKEEALLNNSNRKERNGQLVVLGVLVERLYKSSDDDGRDQWRKNALSNLKDLNLKRALAAFSRLDGED